MFNIQPGQGVGLAASREVAFGLGGWGSVIVITVRREILRINSFITKTITLGSEIWR